MLSFIKDLFRTGISEDLPPYLRRSIYISNRIAVVLSAVGFAFTGLFYNDPGGLAGILVLSFTLWLILLLNKIGWHEFSRGLIMLILTVGILLMAAYGAPARPEFRLPPRLALMGVMAIPMVLFDIRETFWVVIGTLLVIFNFILFEPLNNLIGRPDLVLPFPVWVYELACGLFAFVALMLSFTSFKQFTFESEEQIKKLLDEKSGIESELTAANEELASINESLLEDNISAARRYHATAESELRYQALADATKEGILIHINGHVISVNRAFEEMFGYVDEEITGKPVVDFIKPDDRPLVKGIIFASGEAEGEAVGIRKDGKGIYVSVFSQNKVGEQNTRIVILRNVTGFKHLEIQLRQSQGNLRSLIDNTEDPIWSVDRSLRIVLTNNRFQTLFFNTYGHWLRPGDLIIETLPPASKALWRNYYLRSLDGATLRIEFTFRADAIYELVFNPIYDEKVNVQGVAVFAQDITRRKADEAERQQMQESLSESRSNLYALIENTREMIWSVNTEYEIILMNTAVTQNLLRRDGSPMEQGDNILRNVPREKATLWESYYDRALTGETFKVEHEFYGRIFCEVSFSPIVNERFEITGVAVLAHDISDRKQYEEELLRANRKLASTVEELRTTQRQLLVNEKLAAVGQLVSSIAHEINSPLGAIMSFNRMNQLLTDEIIRDATAVLKELPSDLMPSFLHLVQSSEDHQIEITSREERKYKASLLEQLEQFNISDARELAGKLVRMNVFKLREGFLPLLTDPKAADWVAAAARLAQIKYNSINIKNASERANQIVKALKTYSSIQLSRETRPVDIRQTVEVALDIFQSHLRRNVVLVREYPTELPTAEVFPEELSQVWAILISNAIWAMSDNGTLTIRIRAEEKLEDSVADSGFADYIVVEVEDTGCGIPAENLTKIFEPFFTTKPEGEGAGLGLDVCRKILDKHFATIDVYSNPGKTVFIVEIPCKHPAPLIIVEVEPAPEAVLVEEKV